MHPLRASAHGAGEEDEEGGLADLIAAARVILARPNTRVLMAYRAGAAAIEGAIDLLVVLLAINVLAIGPAAAGYLSAAFGAGGLIGASASVLLVGRRLALPLAAAALIGGAALAALALVSTTLAAIALLLVVGASRSIQSIAAQTLLQRSTPLDVIVCAFVLIESIRDAGLAFGSLAVPLFVSIGGVDAAFVGMGALAPLAVVLTLHRVRSIDRDANIPVVEMGLLRNLGIFSALPAAPLETLAREASYLEVAPGSAVIREGQEETATTPSPAAPCSSRKEAGRSAGWAAARASARSPCCTRSGAPQRSPPRAPRRCSRSSARPSWLRSTRTPTCATPPGASRRGCSPRPPEARPGAAGSTQGPAGSTQRPAASTSRPAGSTSRAAEGPVARPDSTLRNGCGRSPMSCAAHYRCPGALRRHARWWQI